MQRAGAEREGFLAGACGGDDELLREVRMRLEPPAGPPAEALTVEALPREIAPAT